MTEFRFLFLVALIMPTLAGADVYKWTDAQGRIHYSDSPPPAVKARQVKVKVNSIQGPAAVSSVGGSAQAKRGDKVRIYTTAWCPSCKKAKAYLAAKGVPYEELDVETSERAGAEFARLGASGVPVIWSAIDAWSVSVPPGWTRYWRTQVGSSSRGEWVATRCSRKGAALIVDRSARMAPRSRLRTGTSIERPIASNAATTGRAAARRRSRGSPPSRRRYRASACRATCRS
jgi:glutaredoxin